MGLTCVIAEKPSVARDIARVLGADSPGKGCLKGGGYVVTWAVGHLITQLNPDEIDARWKYWRADTLPILPDEIPLKVIPEKHVREQYEHVKTIFNAPQVDRIICATDAGREGELIFRRIYKMTGCQKPFSRLWISSMTEEAIAEGFRSVKDGREYDDLYLSAQCRADADWLVGMNGSRAFTLRYDSLLSVGRVQTPTLSLLVQRELEIRNFVPEDYYEVQADFGNYTGLWIDAGNKTRIAAPEQAQAIAEAVKGREGAVEEVSTERKRVPPPLLYDLTTLQREANARYGFTAQKTLDLAQALYEKYKVLTYPRTDSRHLSQDMRPKIRKVLDKLYLPRESADGILPQFDGYFDLTHIDLTKYKQASVVGTIANDYNTEQISRIQVGKQADVLVLFFLLEELFSPEVKKKNFFYYEERTLHDSSLSRSTHSVLAADLGLDDMAYTFFEGAARTDLGPVMTTSDAGIHAASMGGIWQCVVYGFGGVRIVGDRLRLEPHLPKGWQELRFPLCWKGQTFRVTVRKDSVKLVTESGESVRPEACGIDVVLSC